MHLLFRDGMVVVKYLLSTKGQMVCGVRMYSAPLPQVLTASA